MTTSRREIIETFLASALAMATPQSLYAFAERSQSPNDRFLLVTLRDEKIVAIDTAQGRRAYLLSASPAPDGKYPLSRTGSVIVGGGVLQGVEVPAQSTAYSFVKKPGALEILDAQGKTVYRKPAAPARRG